ncbi:APC family permease [Prosthecobacter sp.]|uniref:APC family permease n=1 Tax=Prosthecobacter sp. TaxID=1965333 RepID=UPI0037850259
MDSTSPSSQVPERRFGLLQATALNMSNMLGAGPFITIPALMLTMGGPQSMLGWGVALVLALADGLVWSELGAMLQKSGGSYVYLREGYGREKWGRFMGFLFIWQFILSGPLELATAYVGVAQYLQPLWPQSSEFTRLCAGAGAGLLVIFLLYRRIESIGKILITLWGGALLAMVVVIVTGVLHFDSKLAFDFPPDAWHLDAFKWGALGAAARIGMYDYLGYYDICFIGDEVRQPGKVIPRAVMLSLVLVALIYFAVNLSIIGVVPWRELVSTEGLSKPVVTMMMAKIYGTDFAQVFTVLVLWTMVACCFAMLLGYSRIPYAAARDGSFFKLFGRLHPRLGFPHVSLMVIGVIAAAATFVKLGTLIDALLTTRIVVQFGGQIGALILLRRVRPELERPFRMWLYPLPALMALMGWAYLLFTTDRVLVIYGMAALLLGGVAFLVWSWKIRRWPFAGTKDT